MERGICSEFGPSLNSPFEGDHPMATQPASMAATARAAEDRDARMAPCQPFESSPYLLSGWRAAAAASVVAGVIVLMLMPALVASGSVLDAPGIARAAAWLEHFAVAAPAVLTARALVALVAVVVIARSDGQG